MAQFLSIPPSPSPFRLSPFRGGATVGRQVAIQKLNRERISRLATAFRFRAEAGFEFGGKGECERHADLGEWTIAFYHTRANTAFRYRPSGTWL